MLLHPNCAAEGCVGAFPALQLAFSAITAILFLQSGIDKLVNWKGEKAYLADHFGKSPLNGLVPVLLPVITLVELAAGCLSAIGFVAVLLHKGTCLGALGQGFALAALTMLFLGQRLAKDYAGAAALVPYFLMMAAGLYVFLQG